MSITGRIHDLRDSLEACHPVDEAGDRRAIARRIELLRPWAARDPELALLTQQCWHGNVLAVPGATPVRVDMSVEVWRDYSRVSSTGEPDGQVWLTLDGRVRAYDLWEIESGIIRFDLDKAQRTAWALILLRALRAFWGAHDELSRTIQRDHRPDVVLGALA